jgi:hypothetical protein
VLDDVVDRQARPVPEWTHRLRLAFAPSPKPSLPSGAASPSCCTRRARSRLVVVEKTDPRLT